jgi:hypothetical protein
VFKNEDKSELPTFNQFGGGEGLIGTDMKVLFLMLDELTPPVKNSISFFPFEPNPGEQLLGQIVCMCISHFIGELKWSFTKVKLACKFYGIYTRIKQNRLLQFPYSLHKAWHFHLAPPPLYCLSHTTPFIR